MVSKSFLVTPPGMHLKKDKFKTAFTFKLILATAPAASLKNLQKWLSLAVVGRFCLNHCHKMYLKTYFKVSESALKV